MTLKKDKALDTASADDAQVKTTKARVTRKKTPPAAGLLAVDPQQEGEAAQGAEAAAEAEKPAKTSKSRRKTTAAEEAAEAPDTAAPKKKTVKKADEEAPAKPRAAKSKAKKTAEAPEAAVQGKTLPSGAGEEPAAQPAPTAADVEEMLRENVLPEEYYVQSLSRDYRPLSRESEVIPVEASDAGEAAAAAPEEAPAAPEAAEPAAQPVEAAQPAAEAAPEPAPAEAPAAVQTAAPAAEAPAAAQTAAPAAEAAEPAAQPVEAAQPAAEAAPEPAPAEAPAAAKTAAPAAEAVEAPARKAAEAPARKIEKPRTSKTAPRTAREDKSDAQSDKAVMGSFSSLIQQMNHTAPKPAPRAAAQPAPAPAAEHAQTESAAQPAPAVETAMTGQEVPAEVQEEEIPLTEIEQKVSASVACEEQHANLNDASPFATHFQYGDGRVETSFIGDGAREGSVMDAEPENTRCFFRCCRGVVAHESTFTPLPEEGYWVPSHPAPRPYHTYPQAQIAVQPIHGDAAQPDASEAPAAQTPAPAAAPGQTEAAAPGRILICWVGKVDISAALRHDSINPGPIRMLLEHVPQFDHVLLLTTMNQSVLDTLRTWLSPCLPGKTLDIQRTQVTDLSDHTLVCQAAVEAVEAVIARYSLPADGTGITFHLSPGSPVTHAILLLLSTIRYHGIRLMQTRLTGLGKAPDILTVSMPDVLRGQGISLDNLPELGIGRAQPAQPAQPQATAPAPAPVQPGAATVVPAHTLLPESEYEEEQARFQSRGRTGRKNLPFPPKSKAPVRGEDLLRRFKAPARKSQPAKSSGGRAAAQTVVHEALPFELDMPLAVQDENSLRAPAANIGRPSRVSPTALQPREGDPPTISSALGAVYKKMQRVATMLLPILLLGESGSGKSRLARYLHEWSGRSGKFVSLDCAGLTDEMFAFELFGRPGASGIRPREGAFRKARSGTLFLENVNLLTPTQQSFLLRVLAPVGETKLYLPARSPFPACTVRVRIIASADNSLLSDIRAGKFRTDLYYRLAGVSTTLPSVREYSYTEREDLLRSFLVSLQHKLGQCWNFSGDAWQTLLDEKWPGNLREVSRILQQICLLSDSGSTITREDVLQQLRQGRFSTPLPAGPEDHADHGAVRPFMGSEYGTGPAISAEAAGYGPVLRDEEEEDEDYEDDGLGEYEDEEAPQDFFVLGSGQSLEKALEQARDSKIMEAMNKARGNRNDAAALLGMSPNQLSYALQRIRNAEQNEGDEDDSD